MHVFETTDPPEVNKLFATLRGGLAFDIGANCGQSVDRLLPGYEQVIAVEPATESFDILKYKWGDDDRVVCLHEACSDHVGTVKLEVRTRSIDSGQLTTGSPGPVLPWGERTGIRDVPSTTVDQLTDRYGTPDLLKVDTEGHESLVLQGAAITLKLHPYVLLEIHSRRNGLECHSMLTDSGYQHLRHLWHHTYKEGSWGRRNHYWLVGT